jgi:surfeit locus 1 family protein
MIFTGKLAAARERRWDAVKPVYQHRGEHRAWTFRASPVVSVAALAVIALTAALGHWQQRRAQEKLALARAYDERAALAVLALPASPLAPEALAWRRVSARGVYAAALSVFLDNKVQGGVAGYHVITPLKLAAGEYYVLVNRGWVAAGPRRDVLPAVPTPAGEQTVEGVAAVPSGRFIELAPDTDGPVRQNLVIERLASQLGVPLEPFVLEQTSPAADGLVRKRERPDAGIDRHRAYALQWYSLAALAALLYVVLNIRRTEPRAAR